MTEKLVTYAQFARLAGITTASMTNLISTVLIDAVVDGRVNINSVSAQDYLRNRDIKLSRMQTEGLDPLYQEALDICIEKGKFNIETIAKGVQVGDKRAGCILDLMLDNDDVPQFKNTDIFDILDDFIPNSTLDKPHKIRLVNPVKKIQKFDFLRQKSSNSESENLLNNNSYVEKAAQYNSIPDEVKDLAHKSLNELVEIYGTCQNFSDWLKSAKLLEDVKEKKLKNARAYGELVSKDLVKSAILAPIDALFTKLLTDGSKTITKRVILMHDSGRTFVECEKFVRQRISSFIKPLKKDTTRVMDNV